MNSSEPDWAWYIMIFPFSDWVNAPFLTSHSFQTIWSQILSPDKNRNKQDNDVPVWSKR